MIYLDIASWLYSRPELKKKVNYIFLKETTFLIIFEKLSRLNIFLFINFFLYTEIEEKYLYKTT